MLLHARDKDWGREAAWGIKRLWDVYNHSQHSKPLFIFTDFCSVSRVPCLLQCALALLTSRVVLTIAAPAPETRHHWKREEREKSGIITKRKGSAMMAMMTAVKHSVLGSFWWAQLSQTASATCQSLKIAVRFGRFAQRAYSQKAIKITSSLLSNFVGSCRKSMIQWKLKQWKKLAPVIQTRNLSKNNKKRVKFFASRRKGPLHTFAAVIECNVTFFLCGVKIWGGGCHANHAGDFPFMFSPAKTLDMADVGYNKCDTHLII